MNGNLFVFLQLFKTIEHENAIFFNNAVVYSVVIVYFW